MRTLRAKSRVIMFTIITSFVVSSVMASGPTNVLASKLTSHSPLCSDTSCRGHDVYVKHCEGSISTIAQASSLNNYVTTYLRKSNTCNSLWARADRLSSYAGNWMLSEALECANNNCIYNLTVPPPNPSTYYYYYPWTGNRQTPSPGQSNSWYSDMVAGSKKACARGWVYTSNPSNYVTNSSVYKAWACNDPGT